MTSLLQSFHHDNFGVVDDFLPFSMTLDATGLLTAGGSLLNRGQAEIKTHITEPASFAVLAVGVLGLIAVRRRLV